ncbi:ILS1_2 [Sanghuangporus weigelae]
MAFPVHDLNAPFDFAKEEEKVLAYWREIDAFQTSLKLSEGRPEFSFYDGPPFATGLPHYGHLLAGTVKDIVTRHAHMSGYHVSRRFGWDTHGLPVEYEIDKKLGITTRNDILKMGIEKYNSECRSIVMRYSSEWRHTVERMGRWIDFDDDYKTLNPSFMESVWWAFSQLFAKGLVYRGTKVMHYSTGCKTPLSNFEADLLYEEMKDLSAIVTFPLVNDPDTSLLAWTTTPYTLPSNLTLCVHPDLTYVKVRDLDRNTNFIILDSALHVLYDKPKKQRFEKVSSFQGREMVGWKYVPIFDYYKEEYEKRAFKVVSDKYVKADTGTGIVHNAPGFGAEDHQVALAHDVLSPGELPPCPVDDDGRLTEEDADKEIMKALKVRGRVVSQKTISHRVAFCWRSKTPLMLRSIPSWFVRVEPIVNDLVKNNAATRWVPQNVGDRRFGNWLSGARDWNVSRSRFWGTPIPLWASSDFQEIVCVGSVEELEELSGVKGIVDLHRESIDHITIPSKQGKDPLKRVDEVFDCWFESGSMPFAQLHYPFENAELFQRRFPADFVSEGIDQTRGWFYTLLILSTHLFRLAPWKNLIVTGLILAEDGKKMSKSARNYPDPNVILAKYGADATRMFLVNSPVVRADNLRFREDGVREVVTRVLLPWLNSFRFLMGQIALLKKNSGIEFTYDSAAPVPNNVMDRWILARCQSLIKLVKEEMAAYRLYTVIPRLLDLIEELTNWYIRLNRRRLKGEDGPGETAVALNTLFETLLVLCLVMSSYTPFITENIYQTLRNYIQNEDGSKDTRSVHFLRLPDAKQEYYDPDIERQVKGMQTVIELARNIRERHNMSLKTPLKELVIFHKNEQFLRDVMTLKQYILTELNVREVVFTSDENEAGVRYRAVADWSVLGKKLRASVGKIKAALPSISSDEVEVYMTTGALSVDGVVLEAGDLAVQPYIELPSRGQYGCHTDGNVAIRLDVEVHEELMGEWLAREVMNRIQKLRKKAGLQATDNVDVRLVLKDDVGQIQDAVSRYEALITKTTGSAPTIINSEPTDSETVASEETEVAGETFSIYLQNLRQ